MIDFLALWNTYQAPITGVGTLIGGWYGKVAHQKIMQRRAEFNTGQQAIQLIQQASAQNQSLYQVVESFRGELEQLRSRNWQAGQVMEQLYGMAIAARLIIREQDAALGTKHDLPPLPDNPFVDPGESEKGEPPVITEAHQEAIRGILEPQ